MEPETAYGFNVGGREVDRFQACASVEGAAREVSERCRECDVALRAVQLPKPSPLMPVTWVAERSIDSRREQP